MNTHRFTITVHYLKATLGLPTPIAQDLRVHILQGVATAESIQRITTACNELRNQIGH